MSAKWRCHDPALHGLPAPVRNHFFYGLLLTDEVLRKDQRYFDGKRWLINRLTLGAGVLTGLDVEKVEQVDEDNNGTKGKRWYAYFSPGVALDGYGREIVVPVRMKEGKPEPAKVPICWISDDGGETCPAEGLAFLHHVVGKLPDVPLGQKSATHSYQLALQIAYHPEPTDPAPVKAGYCANECEPSSVREHYRVRVVKLDEAKKRYPEGFAVDEEYARRDDVQWPAHGNLAKVFPQEPDENVRHRWEAQQATSKLIAPTVPPENRSEAEWVSLGLIELTVDQQASQPGQSPPPPTWSLAGKGRYFRQLFSNDALSKLVFGLADRVDEAARVRTLTFAGMNGASGDAQTVNVYQPLDKPLKIKVVDSTLTPDGAGQILKDHASGKVRFEVQSPDGGMLSTTAFKAEEPYKDDETKRSIEVEINANGTLAHDIHWRLGKRPGLHTVAARIVPAHANDPAFHPGSQLTFHATAKPTAPTIVGMKFLEDTLWHYDPACPNKLIWNVDGPTRLRFYFSRRLHDVQQIEKAFIVWRVYRHFAMGYVYPAEPYRLRICPLSYYPVGRYEETGAEEECWQADFDVVRAHNGHDRNLVDGLCPVDILRAAVLGSIDPEARPEDAPSSGTTPSFPTPQVLDMDFEGSFLPAVCRDALRRGSPHVQDGSDATTIALQADLPARAAARQRLSQTEFDHLSRYWDRFQPRERCFPTGDGNESGDFHKTFEYRLPHC